ncbi:MAG: phage tail tube protein [Cypionkella sp.]
MPRRIRNQIIYAGIETTYGVTPGLVGTDAILVSELSMTVPREGQSRDLIRGFMGASEELVGVRRAEITMKVELAGSGTAGTAPAWGKLLRACACAETITALSRVEYTPITTALESLSMRFENDGVRYQIRGAMGSAKLMMNAYERPMIEFTFKGFDVVATVAANTPPNFAAWQRPLVISDANSVGFKIGCTYATGVLTGGSTLISRGITMDIGNNVQHMQLVGGESIDITGRESSGTGIVELSTTDEVQWRTDMNANILGNIGFSHGTAGNKIVVFAGNVQRLNNQITDYQGRAMTSFDMRVLPTAGNDEFRIVAL